MPAEIATEARPLIPGWERVPPTPEDLRPIWEAAQAALADEISRLNYRAFVGPAQLLALHELPSVAVVGIVPSAEFFFARQAAHLVATALSNAVGRPVEVHLEISRHEETRERLPPEAPSTGPAEGERSALRRRRPGDYRARVATVGEREG